MEVGSNHLSVAPWIIAIIISSIVFPPYLRGCGCGSKVTSDETEVTNQCQKTIIFIGVDYYKIIDAGTALRPILVNFII